MTTARDIMHKGVTCVGVDATLESAARTMRDLGIGALPICGADERLVGILTDRDIVLKCVAPGRDPAAMTAGDIAEGRPYTVDAEADVEQVLQVMEEHRIHRLPVIDNERAIGMISEADLGRHLPEQKVGHFVEVVCADLTGP